MVLIQSRSANNRAISENRSRWFVFLSIRKVFIFLNLSNSGDSRVIQKSKTIQRCTRRLGDEYQKIENIFRLPIGPGIPETEDVISRNATTITNHARS